MKEKGIISTQMFSLCLGKNGGYFQIGGYDGTSHIEQNVTWFPVWETNAYKFNLQGISMNNHLMAGSEEFNVGVIDSGTTFTYVPQKFFNMLNVHFDWFCSLDKANHCKGKKIQSSSDSICFEYDERAFPNGPRNYFMSYPVLNFHTNSINSNKISFKWYPSEYLFRHKENQYCMAIEKF